MIVVVLFVSSPPSFICLFFFLLLFPSFFPSSLPPNILFPRIEGLARLARDASEVVSWGGEKKERKEGVLNEEGGSISTEQTEEKGKKG